MRFVSALRAALAGTVLAGAVLGVLDAATAVWANRAVAPHATLPVAVAAPLVVAPLVLLPLALASVPLLVRRRAGVSAAAALLLGGVAAALVLRAVATLAAAWRDAGAKALVPLAVLALPAALGAAVMLGRAARRLLERVPPPRLRAAVALAATVQVTALGASLWLVARESRGLLAANDGSGARAAAAGSSSSAQARAAAASGQPRHLLLVTIDTLRADHLDREHMPHTTALAAEGVRFDDALAAAPWTLPALASLMTGLPVALHRAGAPTGVDPLARSPLAERHTTLAEHLAAAGFVTHAVVTNPYLGLGFGLGQGFAAFHNLTMANEAALTLRPTLGWWLAEGFLPARLLGDRGAAVTARAARFLRAYHPARRFFLWLHYVDPHAPYDGASRSFRGDLLAGVVSESRLPRMAQLRAGEIRPLPEGRRALREAYARAVREVDAEVGAVLRLLDELGLAASTLVVVVADHGEELWDHGGVEHGHTLYDELVRVPLVVRCPGCAQPGSRVRVPVGVEQLAATLLELLGVTSFGGASSEMAPPFTALLRGGAYAPRPVVSESLLFAEERVALRTARYTYVAWPNGKEELYDRRRDPRELVDLAARRRLVRRQRALLDGARATPGVGGVTRPHADVGVAPVTGVTRRALQALGYVE